jgi:uncharacterized protein (DUF488 family)
MFYSFLLFVRMTFSRALNLDQTFQMTEPKREIWTIGHSTRTLDAFIALLKSFGIQHLVDIRTFPGSRRYPHFNREILSKALQDEEIRYTHMVELGGRRKPVPDSTNTAWRHPSFRGYADYMETPTFATAIEKLKEFASTEAVAYMCSEAVWWKCHRALVSDYLKAHGWTVCHIMDEGKSQEHPYTKPAREAQGKLF